MLNASESHFLTDVFATMPSETGVFMIIQILLHVNVTRILVPGSVDKSGSHSFFIHYTPRIKHTGGPELSIKGSLPSPDSNKDSPDYWSKPKL
jgi:hypothetical protein